MKPYLTKSPENVSTEVGSTVRFSCAAVGLPRPEVSWVKQDGKMSPARTEVEDRSQLKIRSVSSSDAGKYVCRAENIAGAISAAAFLRILSKEPHKFPSLFFS